MRSRFRGSAGLTGALVLLGLFVSASPARAQAGSTIKGQVVFDGPVPKRVEITVNNDPAHCLSKGKLLSDSLVVNAKNKGVRWAVVYLVDVKDATKALPFTAAQAKALGPKVEVDQPCCMFVPHVAVVGPGQALVFKNPAPVTHNVNIQGGDLGPSMNQSLSPGTNLEVPAAKLKPRLTPISVSCSIHNWMKCYVFVLNHPYFAVSDANGKFEIKNVPAGRYRLIVWQGGIGWSDGKSPMRGGGKPINVAGPTDVGQIKMKPSDD